MIGPQTLFDWYTKQLTPPMTMINPFVMINLHIDGSAIMEWQDGERVQEIGRFDSLAELRGYMLEAVRGGVV